MSGTAGSSGRDEFARLLRELKNRSGLSYGALAKRLHMSTSTLHRYCNGSAVPNDYAPVERLARLCRATPDELVELHRQWILADASRGRRAEGGAGPASQGASATPLPDSKSGESGGRGGPREPGEAGEPREREEPGEAGEPREREEPGERVESSASGEQVVSDVPSAARTGKRRRTALIAAVAVAAALGAVALAVLPPGGGGEARGGDAKAEPSVSASASPPARGKDDEPASPSKSATPRESTEGADASTDGDAKGGGERRDGAGTGDSSAAPLHVATRPYVYENPCAQHFLVDSEPEQVGPPASEQDAQRWSAAYGAVSGGEQRVALTIQGTGDDTVVLESLRVRVVGKAAPLAWNDYSMGVGCGGDVQTKSFDIDLDAGSPVVTAKNSQGAFPYKVSESDPKVFYVSAHTVAHDVRWELTLTWSSGDRRGTVKVDNSGVPFRTSGNKGRPGYDYPLGGSEWIERVE
ncbi:helix-turn-helix domain-containing protein [Streptomyces luteolus]|uniref:Helix-turn-helix transcriptional regulator n=1 Tax=Streptomyces luteolus TaxID=3043615 RepID=A0ABT6SQ83_9ACTN|nr:helix-turn-helix transcriptional regulator [Streptomyces sp. B-S-A12]MDI3417771.1 helix-turn-helix transcriptional regulator [Streptomyces sp. B-S-A12]